MATTEGVGEERAYELEVGELPPPPPPPAPGEEPAADQQAEAPTSSAAVAPTGKKEPALGKGWTRDDLMTLIGWIKGPYDKAAELTGDEWLAVDTKEAAMIAVPATFWMPVAWVRTGNGQMSPLAGAIATALTLAWVTGPKVARSLREHPEYVEAIREMRGGSHGRTDGGPGAARPGASSPPPAEDRGSDPRPRPRGSAMGDEGARSRLTTIDPRDL
ncbi:MAG: hypothetical protein KGK34_07295 [Chloroflexota bacterium]|nr:hypothetical protein [Chloroflexota bacterium]